jgi:dTMP kinase
MIVAFEGIDGAGKSTTATLLATMLEESQIAVHLLRKSPDAVKAGRGATQMRDLHKLIWGRRQTEDRNDNIGTYYHLFLHAAWFAGLYECQVRSWLDDPDAITIADGWYYRSVAKAVIREGLSEAWALSLFEHSGNPDVVIFLDTDPATAWTRRGGIFKDSEIGCWDGYTGDRRESFIAYQSLIRTHLQHYASERSWITVGVSPSADKEEIVRQVYLALSDYLRMPS